MVRAENRTPPGGCSPYMQTEPVTRHSPALPELRFSLNLLYVGRLLLGMKSSSAVVEESLDAFDERIEDVTDELVATELLHEAAILAGDILDEQPQSNPSGDTV
jgi:hypothetical protein